MISSPSIVTKRSQLVDQFFEELGTDRSMNFKSLQRTLSLRWLQATFRMRREKLRHGIFRAARK